MIYLDRVKTDAATGSGSGNVTWTAAATQFALPPAGINQTVSYTILDANGIDRETGRATLAESGGTYTLTRGGAQEVLSSSNSGAAVSLSDSSEHTLFLAPAADDLGRIRGLIDEQQASSSAEIVLAVSGLKDAAVRFEGVVPETSGSRLYLTVSTDGGSSWIASGYQWVEHVTYGGGTAHTAGSVSDTEINLSGLTIGTSAEMSEVLDLFGLEAGAHFCVIGRHLHVNPNPQLVAGYTGGLLTGTTDAVTHVKFAMDSGAIASGVFRLIGRFG